MFVLYVVILYLSVFCTVPALFQHCLFSFFFLVPLLRRDLRFAYQMKPTNQHKLTARPDQVGKPTTSHVWVSLEDCFVGRLAFFHFCFGFWLFTAIYSLWGLDVDTKQEILLHRISPGLKIDAEMRRALDSFSNLFGLLSLPKGSCRCVLQRLWWGRWHRFCFGLSNCSSQSTTEIM